MKRFIRSHDRNGDWSDVLMGVGEELVFGFDFTGEGSDEGGINTLNQKLTDIQSDISEIKNDLKNLIDLITNLPEVIRGIVEAALSEEWLTTAHDKIYSINQMMTTPDVYAQNKRLISPDVDDLASAIDHVWNLSGIGWAAASATAPAIGAWAKYEMLILQDSELHPDKPPIQKNGYFLAFKNYFDQLMGDTTKAKSDAEAYLYNVPDDAPDWATAWFFDEKTGEFHRGSTIPHSKMIECYVGKQWVPGHGASDAPEHRDLRPLLATNVDGSYSPADAGSGGWIAPENVQQAIAAWPGINAEIDNKLEILQIVKNIGPAFEKINKALYVPKQYRSGLWLRT